MNIAIQAAAPKCPALKAASPPNRPLRPKVRIPASSSALFSRPLQLRSVPISRPTPKAVARFNSNSRVMRAEPGLLAYPVDTAALPSLAAPPRPDLALRQARRVSVKRYVAAHQCAQRRRLDRLGKEIQARGVHRSDQLRPPIGTDHHTWYRLAKAGTQPGHQL